MIDTTYSIRKLLRPLAFAMLLLTMTIPTSAAVKREMLRLPAAKVTVPACSWIDPDAQAKAIVLAIHGGIQHAGSYEGLAERLGPLGFPVYSIDLRGHGQWIADSRSRPRLDPATSISDVVAITHQLRAEHPGLPIYCMGESLGAAVALHAITAEPKLFDGLILSSAGNQPIVLQDLHSLPRSVWSGVKSLGCSIDLSSFIRRMSDDNRTCREMIDDPSNRNHASLLDLLIMGKFVHANRSLAARIDNHTPVLMLQGTEDRVCDPQSAQRVFDRLNSADKLMKTFPGCGHLIITTQYLKPDVVSAVENWLISHANSFQPSTRS